jgi:hypothetical protein
LEGFPVAVPLWDQKEPKHLWDGENKSGFLKPLEQVWQWLEGSPEEKLYLKTQILTQNHQVVSEIATRPLSLQLPKPNMKDNLYWTRLPYTKNANQLILATKRFTDSLNHYWWTDDTAALFIATGDYRGLSNVYAKRDLPTWASKGSIEIFDLSTHEDIVLKAFKDIRGKVFVADHLVLEPRYWRFWNSS